MFFQNTLPRHSAPKKLSNPTIVENIRNAWKSGDNQPLKRKTASLWHPVGESNPCRRNENPVSWPLDEQGK